MKLFKRLFKKSVSSIQQDEDFDNIRIYIDQLPQDSRSIAHFKEVSSILESSDENFINVNEILALQSFILKGNHPIKVKEIIKETDKIKVQFLGFKGKTNIFMYNFPDF